MAGGIYVSRPFSFNIKCVIFATINILFYVIATKYSKNINYLLIPFIFIISYVGMAWYDVAYNCSNRLYSGDKGIAATFDSIFKDQLRSYKHETKDIILDQEAIYQKNVYLFHILLVTPILIYVGVQGIRKKLKTNDMYVILIVLGIGALLYHGFRFYKPRQTCNIITNDEAKILKIV